MFSRALLLALGLAGLVGLTDGLAQGPEPAPPPRPSTTPDDPPKKDEPKKEPKKEEPKKEPEKKDDKKDAKKDEKAVGFDPKLKKEAPKGLKKYDDVVTKEAKTQKGIFDVHQIGDKVLFEIPADRLGKLMMIRAELAKAPAGGMGGMMSHPGRELGTKFIRLERRENKILVYQVQFDKRAGDKMTQAAVDAVTFEPIIGTFTVEAEGKDRSVVVTATPVFMQDSLDSGGRRAVMGGSIDSERSYLNEVKAFPTNIEARVTLTFRGGGFGGGLGGGGLSFGGSSPSVSTTLVHYSLVALPDEPMMGRLFDPRVGYFTEGFEEYGNKKGWATEKEFITRFRLTKKNPSADVSEVEQPITFYLAPEIPEKWREYLRKGVEDWQPAFEKAGFKNAIVCKDPPKDFDPEDARFSVIRWVADPVANAMGPHVHDPRSGEIISAHIIFWQDIVKLTHHWYFVQCSAQDERARKLPFPDELTGELIRYVAAHEVGHTLGLRHNHRASQAYSIDQLRDPKFVEKNGNVASIMSYGRYNYVAQPEDKIPAKHLIPKLAPYDFFAIEWGYKPVPGAKTPEGEKKTLDEWAARQIKEPFLRFGGEDAVSVVDPTVLTENIGNDPVKATELGLKNLDRVMGYIVDATAEKGENFDLLRETYGELLGHRARWLAAVAKQVGGVVENRTLAGRGTDQFVRVPKDKQQAAVKFLLAAGFTTPSKLIDPKVVNQISYSGVASGIMSQQQQLLRGLLTAARLNRLLDAEVQEPEKAYTAAELVADLQAGLFKELTADAPKCDPLRRTAQRTFVDILKAEFQPQQSGGGQVIQTRSGTIVLGGGADRSSELRAVARVALRDLQKQINEALPKVKDPATKAHLQDTVAEIESALESRKK
ncbi:MAG: zinc-dependent metalloprotease [Gemmataceae bacterium]